MSLHESAVIADSAGVAAALSVATLFHQFSFHEFVGTAAGCAALIYYAYAFVKWVQGYWDNSDGD